MVVIVRRDFCACSTMPQVIEFRQYRDVFLMDVMVGKEREPRVRWCSTVCPRLLRIKGESAKVFG